MATHNGTIPLELEQALAGLVVSKRQHNVALQALEEALGRVEVLEQEIEQLRDTTSYLYTKNANLGREKAKVEREKEELEIRLGLRPPGSTLPLNVGVGAMLRDMAPRTRG